MSTNEIFGGGTSFETFSETGCDELAVEFSGEVVLAGLEVRGDHDVARNEVGEGGAEGEE
jgi:hypothetical protein